MNHDKEIQDLKQQIADLKDEIESFELDPDNYEAEWEESLDSEGEIHIGCLTYSPSYVLKEVDPTAYRCGLTDYVDSLDKENDPKYQELTEELEELEDKLEELESETE